MNSVFTARFRRTTILVVGLAAFLAGLGVARGGVGLAGTWVWLSVILVAVSFKVSRLALITSITLLGLSCGWWRGTLAMQRLAAYNDLYGRPVVLRGKAATDGVYTNNSQLAFDLTDVQVSDPKPSNLLGTISVTGFGAPAVNRSDIVQVEGKLQTTLGSKQGRISFAQIKVLGQANSVIEKIRHGFAAGMQSALPEPLASFGLGLLIGQRNTLPKTVSDQLSAVGLTHLIAVSGYNLTILLAGARRLFGKRSKYQATILSLLMIGSFLLVTGLSASIVRAAIVSILSLAAWYYGRSFRPLLLLLIAAVLTAGWNPLYIWSDIGWYLSFLAFYGVLILAPLIVKRLYGDDREPKALTFVVIETICAQVMTLPIILYIFHQISSVALVANVLVVPLVPAAMLLSFVAGLGGMLLPRVVGWIALPARILLTYMLDVVNAFSRVPHALLERTLAVGSMLLLYGVVVVITLVLWNKSRGNHAKIVIETANGED